MVEAIQPVTGTVLQPSRENHVTKQKRRRPPGAAPLWKRGQSGNPAGRPKKELCIPDILRRILSEPSDADTRKTKLDAIMAKVSELALAGEEWAVQFIAVRTEGKPAETINLNKTETPTIVVERVEPAAAPEAG